MDARENNEKGVAPGSRRGSRGGRPQRDAMRSAAIPSAAADARDETGPLTRRIDGGIDAELQGREASCWAVAPLLDQLDAMRNSASRLTAGVAYPIEHLRNPRQRIDWASFCQLLSNASLIWSDDELLILGGKIVDSPRLKPVAAFGRVVSSPVEYYRWMAEPSVGAQRCLFSHADFILEERDARHVRFHVEVHTGHELPEPFFLICQGLLAAVPRWMGLPDAQVELTRVGAGAHYDVQIPQPPRLWRRVLRRLRGSFAQDAAIRELFDAHAQLREHFAHLEEQIASRERVEAALRMSEAKHRALLITTGEWVWETDPQGVLAYSNGAIEQILGYRSHELIGASALPLIDPGERQAVAKRLASFAEKGEGWTGWVIRWRHRDGSLRFLESNAQPFFDEQGELLGFRGSSRDITHRVQSDAALQESETRYRTLAEATPSGIWHVTRDGRTLYVNPAMCDMLEISHPLEMHGQSWQGFFTNESIAAIEQNFKGPLEGSSASFEVEIIGRGGTRRAAIVRGAPLLDGDGKPQSFLATFTDVTDHRRAEREHRDRLQLMSNVLETMPVAIFRSDDQGQCVEVFGTQALKRVGLTREQFLSLNLKDAFPQTSEFLSRAIAGETVHFETEGFRPDGQPYAFDALVVSDEARGVGAMGFVIDITPRMQAEKRRREIEANLRLIFESAPIAIGLTDEAGCIVQANPAFARMFGYSEPELCGMHFNDLTAPEDLDDGDQIFTALKAGQQHHVVLEKRYRRRDGTPLWGRLVLSAVRDDDGRLVRAVTMIEDVTDRRRAKQMIERGAHILEIVRSLQSRFIAEDDPHSIFEEVLDETLKLAESEFGFVGDVLQTAEGVPYLKTRAVTNIAWNEEMQMFYDEQAADGLEFHELQSLYGEVLTTGQPMITNHPAGDPRRGGTPDGHPLLKSFLGLPIHYGDRLVGMIGVANRNGGYEEEIIEYLRPLLATCGGIIEAIRNDQRRRDAELALRESEVRLRSVIENMPVMMIAFDEHGLLVAWNGECERVTGYAAAEMIGVPTSLERLAPPGPPASIDGSAALRASAHDGWEEILKAKDGSLKTIAWYNISSRVSIPGWTTWTIGLDVTEQRASEDQLRERELQLAHVARLSTMGEMVAGLSHEISQPIHAISNFASACLAHHAADAPTEPAELERWTRRIFEQASRAVEIMQRFRDFARKSPPNRAPTSVNGMIREAVKLLHTEARRCGANIKFNLDEPGPVVQADAIQIQQVLVNLLRNAIEAVAGSHSVTEAVAGSHSVTEAVAGAHSVTEAVAGAHNVTEAVAGRKDMTESVAGAPRRLVTLGTESKDGVVQIQIADNGPGLPAHNECDPAEKVFENFFTTKSEGLGLGLSISRSIVQAHGGRLWAVSRENEGATFYVTLLLAGKQQDHE